MTWADLVDKVSNKAYRYLPEKLSQIPLPLEPETETEDLRRERRIESSVLDYLPLDTTNEDQNR